VLRPGYTKRGAYEGHNSLGLGDDGIAVSQTEPDVGHGTRQAVYFRCIIKTKHVEDYGQ